TTLRRLMERVYPADVRLDAYPTSESNRAVRAGRTLLPRAFEAVPPEQRRQFRLISGHYVFGLHESIPGGRCAYLTFVRDPVERVISLYYHAKQHADHAMHTLIRDEGVSLAAMLDGDLNSLELRNSQTRHLAGLQLDEFLAADPAEVLVQAKRNVDEHFVVAGVMERFEASVVLAAHRLDWGTVHYQRVNVGRVAGDRPEDAPAVRRLIEDANTLDRQLYEHIRGRLDDQLRALGPGLPVRIARLRATNRLVPLYQRARRLAARVKKGLNGE
ncbi:MAG: hypothetical protein ACRELX_11400, partial [Longimicrobiales bacterium]